MAHVAQSAGAAGDTVPMDIDSGTRGLAQSCHHPLSGLDSINVEAVGTEAITARERVPKLLIAEYDKLAWSHPQPWRAFWTAFSIDFSRLSAVMTLLFYTWRGELMAAILKTLRQSSHTPSKAGV
ncbi:hypothetical protein E4U13_005926 [Claviceps humidiphila]|uniref:Uncharacterized protein n=1 Tax=Claviceps humidiphila TaxID=1294629 RepID=A0A9P7Q9K8_9HYPO|nr:hypothetical protein E4U13_005926 [Claviceps humidiphila]